jgi:FixJ family two-component response regulator
MIKHANNIHALLFGLSDDLAGELLAPLKSCKINVESLRRHSTNEEMRAVALSPADIIFCGADVSLVSELRSVKPDASIVVVSRHPEVADWLDSIEAGANDYCAAPFEDSQMKWILETSLRSTVVSAATAAA